MSPYFEREAMAQETKEVGWIKVKDHTSGHQWKQQVRVVHDALSVETLVKMDPEFAYYTLYVEEKKRWFDLQVSHFKVPIVQGAFRLKIRREHILSDTITQFEKMMPDLQNEVKVEFIGEKAIDAGGLVREWAVQLLQELFSQKMSLFSV